MFEEFKGKTAFITGGASGIGKAAARKLGEMKTRVFLADMNEETLGQTVSELKDAGIEASGTKLDVSVCSEVEQAMKECAEYFGAPDIVVNYAGIYRENWFVEMTEDIWRKTIDTNLNGVFNCCHAAMKYMAERKSGSIINMTSQAAFTGGSPQHTHYAASKAGIVGLTTALAKEAARYNVRVNCIAPGIIRTPMTAKYTPEQVRDFLSKIPLGRFGEPEEVANIILFLASDMSSYMTGQTLNATGGWLLHS